MKSIKPILCLAWIAIALPGACAKGPSSPAPAAAKAPTAADAAKLQAQVDQLQAAVRQAQALINALADQRNQALNENAQLRAQIEISRAPAPTITSGVVPGAK